MIQQVVFKQEIYLQNLDWFSPNEASAAFLCPVHFGRSHEAVKETEETGQKFTIDLKHQNQVCFIRLSRSNNKCLDI